MVVETGMNLSRMNYYSTQWWSTDLARWREWFSQNYWSSHLNSGRFLDLAPEGHPAKLVQLSGSMEAGTEIDEDGDVVVESVGHELVTGDVVDLSDFDSTPSIGSNHQITVIDDDHFRLNVSNMDSIESLGTWEFRQMANITVARDLSGRYPAGDYVLKAEGTGDISVSLDATNDFFSFSGGTEQTVSVSPGNNGVRIQIQSTDESDPVRNVEFLMPSFTDDSPHPLFLSRLQPFQCVRFLNASLTNGSNVSEWSHRNTPNYHALSNRRTTTTGTLTVTELREDSGPRWTNWGWAVVCDAPGHGLMTGHSVRMTLYHDGEEVYETSSDGSPIYVIDDDTFEFRVSENEDGTGTGGQLDALEGTITGDWRLDIDPGLPWEWMIDLCNELQCDMWICVPALANENYQRELARLLRDNLDSGLTIYLEWSNEHWNTIFSVYWQCRFRAEDDAQVGNTAEAYAQYSKELFDVFLDEFSGQTDRLVRVVAGQVNQSNRMDDALTYLNGDVDAVASTTYFRLDLSQYDSSTTVQELADDLLETDFDRSGGVEGNGVSGHGQLASQHGIRYIAYEGGQHLRVNNETQVEQQVYDLQTHPAMYDAYEMMLQNFEDAGGDLLVAYSFTGQHSRSGSWGHLLYQDSDPQDHPKYLALVEWGEDGDGGGGFTTTLGGTVRDPDGNTVEGAKIYVINTDDDVLEEVTTSGSDGKWEVEVPAGHAYHCTCQYDDGQGGRMNSKSLPYVGS